MLDQNNNNNNESKDLFDSGSENLNENEKENNHEVNNILVVKEENALLKALE